VDDEGKEEESLKGRRAGNDLNEAGSVIRLTRLDYNLDEDRSNRLFFFRHERKISLIDHCTLYVERLYKKYIPNGNNQVSAINTKTELSW
jgi:hypothetical protein